MAEAPAKAALVLRMPQKAKMWDVPGVTIVDARKSQHLSCLQLLFSGGQISPRRLAMTPRLVDIMIDREVLV